MSREELAEILRMPGLPGYLDRVDEYMMAQAGQSLKLEKLIEGVIRRPGKRLRPSLLIAAALVGNKPMDEKIILSASAVELVHLASLLHDGIIDRDMDLAKNSQALLAGDYLLSAGISGAAMVSADAAVSLSGAVSKMAAGQDLQLSRKYQALPHDDVYLKVAFYKTGELFSSVMRIGAMHSGQSYKYLELLSNYGRAFGGAFQLIDDIADEEFEPRYQPDARKIAHQYCVEASRYLDGLADSRIRAGLKQFPARYLELTLGPADQKLL